MLCQLVELGLRLACLLLRPRVSTTSAHQDGQTEQEHDQRCLGHPLRDGYRMRFVHRELPPTTFSFLFAFFFTGGLASLFFATSPTWSWHSWHTRHPCISTILASQLRPFAFASAHLADHCTHFIELLEQLVDILDGRATTTSNTFAAAAIDNLRIVPLLFGHGQHNRLDMFHLVAFQCLFHLRRRCQLVEAWNHLHDLPQGTHTFQLTHGSKKIFQVKFALL